MTIAELEPTTTSAPIPGPSIFALGAISFVYFALNLMWQGPAKKAAIVPTTTPAEVV